MAATSNTRRQGSPLWLKIVIGVIGIGTLAAVILVSVMIFGQIHGEEFSPQTFDRREFVYFQIPLVQIKVSPVVRTPKQGNVEKHLLAEKLIAPATATTTWDLVEVYRGAGVVNRLEGEAKVLALYLDTVDAGSKYTWEKWSEDHPKSAAIFWPVVMTFAQEGLYLQLPPLFRAAREATSASELQTRLSTEVKQIFTELAEREEKRGNAARAAEWRQKSEAFKAEPIPKDLTGQPERNKAEHEANRDDGQ